jgi:hypothetical protein
MSSINDAITIWKKGGAVAASEWSEFRHGRGWRRRPTPTTYCREMSRQTLEELASGKEPSPIVPPDYWKAALAGVLKHHPKVRKVIIVDAPRGLILDAKENLLVCGPGHVFKLPKPPEGYGPAFDEPPAPEPSAAVQRTFAWSGLAKRLAPVAAPAA